MSTEKYSHTEALPCSFGSILKSDIVTTVNKLILCTSRHQHFLEFWEREEGTPKSVSPPVHN